MQSARAVLYCRLCPVRLYQIFTHLINDKIFGKVFIDHKMHPVILATERLFETPNFKPYSANVENMVSSE